MRVEVAGENALILYFSDEVSEASSAYIYAMTQALEALIGKGVIDLVPSYASLLIIFDHNVYDYYSLKQYISKAKAVIDQTRIASGNSTDSIEAPTITLPVYYGTEAGPDLEELARNAQLTTEEVIAIHQAGLYQVYAIGFAPGFAFLGQVDERIAAPRKSTPRKAVPKGAVAIADRQTAVYPSVSPGGWNLIGLCPVPMFDAEKTPSMPLATGNKVKFEAISKAEFIAMGGEL
ncbi:5-oxoprolinase subunit PxpB [Marinomonas sp. C2222]|uniref:5-oxoprolinase subunit PxpB n=1 Tax=Marinomonas sargassi TaxID=2984494 RepID=A0ABT2YSW5_9GAMM|nr:5-oxoprolinase subunit PxpB [Marinomonas sargassi]MCV2402978.1 5-oxoprolinase subunit PxpB [Marinomonas sargassi]